MWLKLLGSLLIVISGIALGFSTAGRFVLRPRQIRQVIICLANLKSLISYAAMPLSEALKQCAQSVDGPIQRLFITTSELLVAQGWLTPREAFEQAQILLESDLALEAPEKGALSALGTNLGSTNRSEQDVYLQMVQRHLEKIEQEAISLRDRNVKMYRYLGVCGGLAVVILLV